MMRRIVTTFPVKPWIGRLAGWAGIRSISQSGLIDDDMDAFTAVGIPAWATAQIAARRAFSAIRDSAATPIPAACRVMGLDEAYGRDALAQWLTRQSLYRLNFAHTCRLAFPDAVVVADFPPRLRQALVSEGFRFHTGLSNMAWAVRHVGLVATALVAHALHAVLRIRDEVRPTRLEVAADARIALWPAVFDNELGQAADGLNVSDFVAARRDIFPADIVICQGNPRLRHARPVIVSQNLFNLRRNGRSSLSEVFSDIALQIRLAWAAVAGGWVEAMLARETAKMPRIRACLADLRPEALYCSIGQLQYLSFWFAIARQAGVPLRVLCNSTQLFPVQDRTCEVQNVIPDIYMLLSAEEYLVWDDAHAADMRNAGVPADALRVTGPVVFSGAPPRRCETGSRNGIVFDYFDQAPCSRRKLVRMGAPAVYHTPERLIAALEDIVGALEKAYSGRDWVLRIKTKRRLSDQEDVRYAELIEEIADRCPNVTLVNPITSPLALHADSTATLGFPFVSPVVSAAATNNLVAFYDPDGSASEPGEPRGIRLLHGRAELEEWLATEIAAGDRNDAATGAAKTG